MLSILGFSCVCTEDTDSLSTFAPSGTIRPHLVHTYIDFFPPPVSVHAERFAHLKHTLFLVKTHYLHLQLQLSLPIFFLPLHPLKMRSSSPDAVINSKLQQLLMATPIKTAGINLPAIYSISEVSSFTSPVNHPMVTEACHSSLQITGIGQGIESVLL